MHLKMLEGQISGQFTVSACGPLLIRSGRAGRLRTDLSDTCFLTGDSAEGRTCVIPGASLKGVIRSYSVQNGLLTAEEADGLFGSRTPLRGRLSLSDAYADCGTVRLIRRSNTAIGAASQRVQAGSLNTVETVSSGDFPCSFRLINPTDREVRAFLAALDAMNRHILPIGGRTGSGYGRVQISRFRMQAVGGFTEALRPVTAAAYDSLEQALAAYRKEDADAGEA